MIISGEEQNPLKCLCNLAEIWKGIILIFYPVIPQLISLNNRCDRTNYINTDNDIIKSILFTPLFLSTMISEASKVNDALHFNSADIQTNTNQSFQEPSESSLSGETLVDWDTTHVDS